jgi:hypothetical protein
MRLVGVCIQLLVGSIAASALLSGCASVKESYAPDGRKAYALNCSGTARGWDKCYAAAGDLCKDAGYDVIDRTSEDAAFSSIGGAANRSNASIGGASVKTNERSMMIACKQPPK